MTVMQGSNPNDGSGNQNSESGDGNTPANTSNTATGSIPPAGTQVAQSSPGDANVTALTARLESLETEVKKARSDAAKYRTRLKALAADDGDGKPESAVSPEISAELTKLREGRIKDQLTLAATGAGAHYPDQIYRFVDMAEVAGDDGSVPKPDKLMADLRKEYPHLFKPLVEGPGDGGGGSQIPSKPGDMNTLLRTGFRSLRGQPSN